jgi:hypothetical protein
MSISVDDEVVKLLLSGIFKSGKTVFFKIDSSWQTREGKCRPNSEKPQPESRYYLPADSRFPMAGVEIL